MRTDEPIQAIHSQPVRPEPVEGPSEWAQGRFDKPVLSKVEGLSPNGNFEPVTIYEPLPFSINSSFEVIL
jgi:hypothetical protein